ncbi:IclR family transcriptional regulator [Tamaricihabitans halophyticus]|uniref:IclR family transcriptional regulator n=1 Tax=Tamaricihabitans halophyticus TaxID=1262583 RepID=A0A4R2QQ56_9PSEU|nr:IclR family transcriptional regulator [Tamaricihabitans halophyticus]TCP51863.1 IclR family transcriptional regulator [Tamaricihabitans halophyticus]
MAATGGGQAKEHRTVSRVTTILETVAGDQHGVRLGVLAGVLDAPKTSVHGLVKGLVATGYLREQDGVYLLGPAVGAVLAPPRPWLLEAAHPVLERIRAEFDETVMLAIQVGDSVVYLDTIESTQLVRYSAPLRRRRPLYPTSSGKCLLAHADTRRQEAYLREHFAEPAERARVGEELRRVAAEGVAYNQGETVPDVLAVASLVSAGEQPAGCIAVAGPITRMTGKLDPIAATVREAVGEISNQLH